MLGFLMQWSTLPTLSMFPVLVWMYRKLARQEESDAIAEFSEAYAQYAAATPAFLPRLSRREHVPLVTDDVGSKRAKVVIRTHSVVTAKDMDLSRLQGLDCWQEIVEREPVIGTSVSLAKTPLGVNNSGSRRVSAIATCRRLRHSLLFSGGRSPGSVRLTQPKR